MLPRGDVLPSLLELHFLVGVVFADGLHRLRHVFLVHFARLPLDLFLLGLGALAVLFLQRLCLVVSVDDALDHVLHENTSIL